MTPRNFQLHQMRARREETRARLAILHQRISREAEPATRSDPGLPQTFGRHATNWTTRDEQDFQRRLDALRLDARNEIGSIRAKLLRQNTAITALRLRIARQPET